MDKEKLLQALNNPSASPDERLCALKKLSCPKPPDRCRYVNNHIHTTYSFSPYTPAAAVYYAAEAGLSTAGIMDHDSVGGCSEFIEAGKIAGMPVTIGFECRTSVAGTPLEGLRLNNPDQKSVAYVTLHGIPHGNIRRCEKLLAPLREKRNQRNIKMCGEISRITGFELSFEADVLPLSKYDEGGSVTERHVLYALVKKLLSDDRDTVIEKTQQLIGKELSPETKNKLLSAPEQYFSYDLLGILKSSLVEKIYVDADDELLHIRDFTRFAAEVGAISAYAYLGDVTISPTGDKKAQSFEDSYLDLLICCLKDFGFNAVTYMPSRNTEAQLKRITEKCRENGLFQVSGEDINSPRQSFVCEAMRAYPHLFDSTYALIGHETAATEKQENGMFSAKTIEKMPDLNERIAYFAEIGRKA